MASQAGHDLDVFDTSSLTHTGRPPSANEDGGTDDSQPSVTHGTNDEDTLPTPPPAKPAS
ncbi:MAG: hypothetical protein COU35_05060 [Candidatus Magasanikbacteria bacterium CG10_big_fil_rev_8_21_14_0_10_47_10]|uniref:Uncharacterized protein n=1 Tax=Candidatus Magasanikbacteria bacterium CG10_big_fil_rev_8_21_14_0_10_47_10 TaxID=1974652 RepID=A0A2H0TP66_9BACT|nr:MAG: hypothetical protein COU35_05060 [Candidatus Magasanikbacteria bacterium CG10_big_fil_rev_8_21_14_0_10_47_10]